MTTLVLYTKNNCPYCAKAKAFLQIREVEFREINIDTNSEAKDWVIKNNHKTMPQIYYDDYTVDSPKIFVEGGYDGLAKLTPREFAQKID